MARSTTLTCRELVELVTEYLEGTMSHQDRLRFEEHLASCPGCATYVEQIRQTISMVGRISEELIPVRAQDELLQAFRDWKACRADPGP